MAAVDPLTDLSADAIAAAIERGPVEYWRSWCAHHPGAVWDETPQCVRFLTGVPFAPCNQVFVSALPQDGIDTFIADTLAPYRARSLPMLWSVSPTVPQGLGEAPEAAGLRPGEEALTGMAIDLAQLPAAKTPATFELQLVTDHGMLDTWGRVYHEAFSLPEGFADAFVATFRRAGLDGPFRHYLGRLDGEPVACSTMFLCGTANLWHIATLDKARRRGIGSAMTLAPLRDARELGYTLGTLYASEMGAPVYARLGFTEYHRIRQYMWSPENANA